MHSNSQPHMRLILSVVLMMISASVAVADDWPTYRRDIARTGISTETIQAPLSPAWVFSPLHRPSHAWGDPQPKEVEGNLELPRMRFDDVFHTAVVGDGVYFASSSDNKVYCLNAKNGQVRWEFFTDGPVRLAPTVSGGKVYVGSDDGKAYCIDARTGKSVWTFQAAPEKRFVLGNGKMISLWPVRTGVVVDRGLGDIKRGTVKQLRIVQILPKTTNLNDRPAVGLAQEENARAILGTVPVEADGSARFIVPARKPILFQALDANGLAVQTMRSLTYLQPGESVSCVGCHEPLESVPATGRTIAMKRKASKINPGKLGGRTFSFMRVVQPVLDKHCVKCHPGDKAKKNIDLTSAPLRGFSRSYISLCADRNFWGAGTNPKNAKEALVPRFGAHNVIQVTPPGGMYGSPGSRLIKLLRDPKGHHKVKLSPDNIRRIAAWIDCNAIFYGVYDPKAQAQQLKGMDVPMPEIQ